MRKKIFIAIGTLLAALIVAVLALLYTPPGRAVLANIAESALGDSLGGRVEIGKLEGAPPGRLLLHDVAINDENGAWLVAKKIELDWRPIGLFYDHIFIRSLAVEDATVFRSPERTKERDEDARRINILEEAPHITLDDLTLTDVKLALNGSLQRVDGAGSARLNGPEINLRLTLTSDAAADQADITVVKSRARDRLYVDTSLNAEPGGVIATVFGLHAPLHLAASADGKLSDAAVNIGGVAGNFGVIETSVAGDLRHFTSADIRARLEPGSRLSHLTEFSAPLALDAHYETKSNGGALGIRSLASALGDISGTLNWTAPRGSVDKLAADLSAALAPEYRPEFQEIAGEQLTLRGVMTWRRDDYALRGVLTGALATFTLKNGATDLRGHVTGDAVATFAARDAAILAEGATVEGKLNADLNGVAVLNTLTADTPGGAHFAGAGSYNFTDDVIALDGDATLPAAFVRRIFPDASLQGDIVGDLKLDGLIDLFTLDANFDTPRIVIGKGSLPPLSVDLSLSGLPRLPNGEIDARASDGGPRRLSTTLRSSTDGAIRAPRILYEGRGFHLAGSGALDPDGQTIDLDLTYEGDENAEPWPGLHLEGDVKAKGVLSRDSALNKMTAAAELLRMNDWRGENLSLRADGPPGGVSFALDAALLEKDGAPPFEDISAEGVADARQAPKVSLMKFSAVAAGLPARLTAPAALDFSDGVAVKDLRLSYGDEGAIALDGAFSDQRWRGRLDVKDAPIPEADGLISLNAAIDTDAKTPARGGFTLRTLLIGDNSASINGDLLWDGRALRVVSKQDGFDLDLRAPLRLLREPALGVDNEGKLSGHILYDGDVEAIAAYLPPALQTVEGALKANFTLAGTIAKPVIEGSATLTDGAYLEIESGFALTGLHAEAATKFAGGGNQISFTGGGRGAEQTGADTMTFVGGLRFGAQENIDFKLHLDGAEFSAFPVTRLRADGDMTISGRFDALAAKGDFDIRRLDAEIITPDSNALVPIDIVDANDRKAAGAPAKRNGLDYEVHLGANDKIFITGRGVESEWKADATIYDGRDGPLVIGELTLREGVLDFAGRRFEMTRGVIRFDRFSENNPTLDMRAEYESGGVTAAIIVTGRANKPEVSLTATGASAEEAMALVMFGKPLRELSASEAVQSAEALAALTGQGVFGGDTLTGKLKRTVGLDLLNVDLDPQNGGGSLTVGKEVVNGVFVSAKQDIQGEAGSVRVKANVTKNITVETEIEQTGEQTVSANWKKDF
ncbi:MAG: translocation/assembly module TamB domain-containing protein [Parvularculaceae bacterium]